MNGVAVFFFLPLNCVVSIDCPALFYGILITNYCSNGSQQTHLFLVERAAQILRFHYETIRGIRKEKPIESKESNSYCAAFRYIHLEMAAQQAHF